MQVKTVLLVDDNKNILRIAEIALSQEFDVYTAETGRGGIALAEAKDPDLIVLDVRMPELDGPQTLARLKQNPKTAHIPVILMSASIQTDEIQRYKKLDVLGVIEKPFDPLKICGLITTLAASK